MTNTNATTVDEAFFVLRGIHAGSLAKGGARLVTRYAAPVGEMVVESGKWMAKAAKTLPVVGGVVAVGATLYYVGRELQKAERGESTLEKVNNLIPARAANTFFSFLPGGAYLGDAGEQLVVETTRLKYGKESSPDDAASVALGKRVYRWVANEPSSKISTEPQDDKKTAPYHYESPIEVAGGQHITVKITPAADKTHTSEGKSAALPLPQAARNAVHHAAGEYQQGASGEGTYAAAKRTEHDPKRGA